MKKLLMIFILLLISVSSVYAGDLADVQSSGVLRMGVSPDRSPFAFYDRNDDLTGIDVKLMEEIADRMNVRLEVSEMSPEDLAESLTLGRSDVIGGAFSRLSSRKNEIDYSNTYYSTTAVFACRAGSCLPEDPDEQAFSGLKIGVLKGSGFEEWLKNDLVDQKTVQMKDIYSYSKIEDAMKALGKGKIDLVMIDTNIFSARYQGDANYAFCEYEEIKDNYAFGVRKGSDLKAEINKHLSAILRDGTAQQIADAFFSDSYTEEQPMIVWTGKTPAAPTAAPVTVPTTLPPVTIPTAAFPTIAPMTVPTAVPTQSGNCTFAMSYVADVTVPDGQQVNAGSAFTKIWRIKNTGTCTWTTDFNFTYVSGAQMSGSNGKLPKNVPPGDTVDISLDLVAPTVTGTYRGYWQIRTPKNYSVGPAIWVEIKVTQGTLMPPSYYIPTPTPYYYNSLDPTVYPTDSYAWVYTWDELQAQLPVIESYYPNAYTNKTGQCVTVYWNVTNAGTVELLVDGKSFYFGSPGTGMSSICDEVKAVGVHNIKLCGYNAGGIEKCETLIYTTIP